ncbi:hypothetical protein [Pedobacter nyackensis]|uniref:hypothetical protein n=1 Tax=Pedobacter nyackensis TaxID=475255 RepID=UPI000A0743C5|nr:hypothetical protein [Pedobacter nyackensis]
METKANLSFKIRAFAQVMIPVLWLLGCLYRALGCLSGKRGGCLCFSHCFVRNRRYALFPGGTNMDKLTEANIG